MKELSDLTFETFVEKGLVCVDFYAGFCQPCKKLAEILERLQFRFSNIQFGSVNIEECMEASIEFNIMCVPTLVLFRDGSRIDKIEGLLSEKKLVDRLEALRGEK